MTDGPELFRTWDNHLLILWSSFGKHGYVETVARSKSGTIQGPWEQLPPLLDEDGGHGMLFQSFDGKVMFIMHRTNRNPHGKIFEIADKGDYLEVVRECAELNDAQ